MDLRFGCHRVVVEWEGFGLNPSGMTQVYLSIYNIYIYHGFHY